MPRTHALSIALGALLFASVATLCILWSAAVPRGEAPDEPDHLAMVEFVAAHGRLPRYGEGEFTVALMATNTRRTVARPGNLRGLHAARIQGHPLSLRQPYVFLPQLPYALAGGLCRVLGRSTTPFARAFNALCIAGAALATFVAGRALWPERRFAAVVAGACVGLWPQITFLGAYANDDAFAICTSSILIATCVVLQSRRFDRRGAAGLGAAIGLVAVSKPYAMALLPLAALWLWRIARQQVSRGVIDAASMRRRLLWTAAVAIGIVAPGLIRNALLYDGDPSGRRVLLRDMRAFVAELPADVAAQANLLYLKPERARPKLAAFGAGFWRDSAASAWARFGWMNIVPPRWVTRSAGWLLALGLVAAFWRQRRTASSWWSAPGIFALPGLALLIAASIANAYWVDFQPQGRYLLPCAPAVILQIVAGIAAPAAVGTAHPFTRTGIGTATLAALLAFFLVQNLFCRFGVLG